MTLIYGLLAASPTALLVAQGTAKSTSKSAQSSFSSWGLFIVLGLMFVVMYFLLYRPQKKRQQEAQDLLGRLVKGDEVVTIGGIHGTLKKITDDTVVIEVDKGVRMTFSRTAIARTLTVHEEEEAEPEEAEPAEEPASEEEEYEEYEELAEEYEEEPEPSPETEEAEAVQETEEEPEGK